MSSFALATSVCDAASLALVIIPLSPITKLILTPANINKTTIVTTNAINVIPFIFLVFFLNISILPSLFMFNNTTKPKYIKKRALWLI